MFHPFELVQSVEWIWILWLATLSAFGWLTACALHRLHWRDLRRILVEEDGAAYTLSYVMVIPIYMLLMCLIIETTLVLVAKVGTVYAAYAGTRSAIVWSSARPSEVGTRTRYAAVKAFVPFASGRIRPSTMAASNSNSDRIAPFLRAYRAYAPNPASSTYLRHKYKYAQWALDVTTVGLPASTWNGDITVKVKYRFPFNVPGIGRLLGTRGPGGHYYYEIASQATLQNEGPKNNTQTLGIKYEPR